MSAKRCVCFRSIFTDRDFFGGGVCVYVFNKNNYDMKDMKDRLKILAE